MMLWRLLCCIVIPSFIVIVSKGIAMDCCYRCWQDCEAYFETGHKKSGVYHVYPDGMRTGYDVYCDMTTDDGGWLVFQRRLDGTVDFYRGWESYSRGFGDVSGEHWLGLYPLQRILSQGRYELRVDMEDWEGGMAYATYNVFEIGPFIDNFRLTVGVYNGTAGDSLSQHNGHMFSTRDKDNDVHIESCANRLHGAWWYESCGASSLNGVYKLAQDNDSDSVFWYHWKQTFYGLKSAEMKIRRA